MRTRQRNQLSAQRHAHSETTASDYMVSTAIVDGCGKTLPVYRGNLVVVYRDNEVNYAKHKAITY